MEKTEVTATHLVALRECKQSYTFRKMSLKDEYYDKRKVIYDVLKALAEGIDNMDSVTQKIRSMYLLEWYPLSLQHELEVQEVTTLINRMGNYLKNYISTGTLYPAGYITCDVNMNFKGVDIDTISSFFHFIVEREDCIEGIILKPGSPKESCRARKAENKPDNSIDIIAAYGALRKRFPDKNIRISLFYLKSKDKDKTEYEARHGENIISVDYTKESFPDLLTYAMNIPCSCDCDTCHFRQNCQAEKISQDTYEKPDAADSHVKEIKFSGVQLQAVNHMYGPLLIEAVPGSGKTTILVHRLLSLISKGVNPKNILMITFAKKAAEEISERVRAELRFSGHSMPEISTFNALGYAVLRKNPGMLPADIKLATDTDIKELIYKALKQCSDAGIRIQNVNYSALFGEWGLINSLYNWFVQIDTDAELFEKNNTSKDLDGIFEVYRCYKQLFKKEHYISFDDQIILANKLFENNPTVLSRYQETYQYIMVDEFQDINEEQFKFLSHLTKKRQNIVAVGDCDQLIYGFRGGSNFFSLHFKEYYPDAKIIFMQDNYRCTESIINAANSLIEKNSDRYNKRIIPHKKGSPVYLYKTFPESQIGLLVSNILTRYKVEDVAVLSRKNNTLSKFKKILDINIASEFLIEQPLFKALSDILTIRFKGIESDDNCLYRLLLNCGAAAGDITKSKGFSLYSSLTSRKKIPAIGSTNLLYRADDALWNAGCRIVTALNILDSQSLSAVTEACNVLFGISSHPVLDELANKAYERAVKHLDELFFYMQAMERYSDTTKIDITSQSLNLLTAHASKGKEFKCVIVYGAENFYADEEERRLLYVAMTRAKEDLIIIRRGPGKQQDMIDEFIHCCKVLSLKKEVQA